MRVTVVVAVLASLGSAVPVAAQVSSASVERTSAVLNAASTLRFDASIWTDPPPKRLGILTVLPPTGPGEFLRVRVSIGELVSKAVSRVQQARYERREAAARRDVQATLDAYLAERRPR